MGKTSLVVALAKAAGKPLTRINLSEQTDLMDLFGSDVPVTDAEAGKFAWRDASFLAAMKSGGWVLLDEMNLASQSVLEGLNACLDHRGEVFVPELNMVFKRHREFRLFAAQNPHSQGAGRKGLPSSFVNRFSVIYTDILNADDLFDICEDMFPDLDYYIFPELVHFVPTLERETAIAKTFGQNGAPWEFNLRDILRTLQLLRSKQNLLSAADIKECVDILFTQRFRTKDDREAISKLYMNYLYPRNMPLKLRPLNVPRSLCLSLSSTQLQVGLGLQPRASTLTGTRGLGR